MFFLALLQVVLFGEVLGVGLLLRERELEGEVQEEVSLEHSCDLDQLVTVHDKEVLLV